MAKREIYPPSGLRLIRLYNGKICEFCFNWHTSNNMWDQLFWTTRSSSTLTLIEGGRIRLESIQARSLWGGILGYLLAFHAWQGFGLDHNQKIGSISVWHDDGKKKYTKERDRSTISSNIMLQIQYYCSRFLTTAELWHTIVV